MGIVDFLKKFFRGEEEKAEEVKEIELEDLGKWIEELAAEKIGEAEKSLVEVKGKIREEKEKIRERMAILEKAELKNKEVPDKVKQIMEGNRETYLQKIGGLLGEIEIPEKFKELSKFVKNIEETMNAFDKGIAKSHHVMSEFLIKETRDLSESMRNLDKHVKHLGKIVSIADLDSFDEIKNSVASSKNKIEEKGALLNKIGKAKNEIEERKKEVGKIAGDLERAEQSKENKKFIEINENRASFEKQKKELERKMLDSFSAIEPALKKYSKLDEKDKTARKYLDNPLSYLLTDRELQIGQLLKKVRESIEAEKFELKDKKKDRILNELGRLDRNYFENFLREHSEIESAINKFDEELGGFTIEGEVEKLRDELSVSKTKLENDFSGLGGLEEKFGKIDVGKLKKNLEWEVKEGIGRSVKII